MKPKLVIFVRAPELGQVKTRLAKAIGPAAALTAYETLVKRLLTNLRSLEAVELRFTPDQAGAKCSHWLRRTWHLEPQGLGDLGERLARCFLENFQAGFGPVVIIGSDCPEVQPQDIQNAWNALVSRDAVVGSARDGGYWLIGLRQSQPALFQNMPWGTSAVLETTLARLESANLTVHCLRTLRDVDTVEDWNDFNNLIQPSAAQPSARHPSS